MKYLLQIAYIQKVQLGKRQMMKKVENDWQAGIYELQQDFGHSGCWERADLPGADSIFGCLKSVSQLLLTLSWSDYSLTTLRLRRKKVKLEGTISKD